MKSSRLSRISPWTLGMAFAIALMLACFAIAVNAYWVGDDFNYVRPKTWGDVAHFFDPVGRAQFRPLTWLTWAGDFALFGTAPLGWHLTRLVQHAVNMVFAGLLVRDLTGRRSLAVLAAALFAIQPAQPETVTWLGGQADASFAMWWLPALWLFVRWRQGAPRSRWWLAGVLGFISMFGKEAAVTLPVMSLWIDLLFGRECAGWPGERGSGWWRSWRLYPRLLLDHSLFIAASAFYIGLRLVLFITGQGRLMYGEGQLGFFTHALDVITGYIVLAVGLWWLPVEVAAWPAVVKLAIGVTVIVAAVLLVRWLGRVALFALGWCAITLLLTLQAVALRWFYLPALGVGLLIAAAWAWLDARGRAERGPLWRALSAVPLIFLVGWAVLTTFQNELWRQSGEVAGSIMSQVRAEVPVPKLPATFYMANPPYSYRGVLLFNSGFDSAVNHVYNNWADITAYSVDEDKVQVAQALADPSKLGPNPVFLRYEDGKIVRYPDLASLVNAGSR